jgi:hypothetical protein
MKKYYLIYEIQNSFLTDQRYMVCDTKEKLEEVINGNKIKIAKVIYGEEFILSVKEKQ